jgi:hypothetical protein
MPPIENLKVYEPSYQLLEEARKFWDHAVSDTVVYSLNPSEVTRDIGGEITKHYVNGKLWIECHLTFVDSGNRHHYIVLIEVDSHSRNERRRRMRPVKVAHATVDRNSSVLVDIAQGVQTPERIALDGRSVRSVVRLKRFYDLDCVCGHARSLLLEGLSGLGVENVEDRELGMLGIRESQLREKPDQLVQGRPQAVEQVSDDERNSVGRVRDLNADAMALMFNIILANNGIRFRFTEGIKLLPQGFKVFLRPGGLQIGIS